MSDPSDWARLVENEIHGNQEERGLREQSLITRRKLIDAHAPELWKQVGEEFRRHCDEYNKLKTSPVLVFSFASVYLFIVRRDGTTAALTGCYDPSTKAIQVSANNSNASETYIPKVIPEDDGKVVLVSQNERHATTPTDIAQNTLREFLLN
jgi:hypothetical protein